MKLPLTQNKRTMESKATWLSLQHVLLTDVWLIPSSWKWRFRMRSVFVPEEEKSKGMVVAFAVYIVHNKYSGWLSLAAREAMQMKALVPAHHKPHRNTFVDKANGSNKTAEVLCQIIMHCVTALNVMQIKYGGSSLQCKISHVIVFRPLSLSLS